MAILNQVGQAKIIGSLLRNNFLLDDFSRADFIFRKFSRLSPRIRGSIVDTYTRLARQGANGRIIPERLTLFLTNQCNMKCAHCFIVKEHQPRFWEMGLDEYRRLFQSIRGHVSQVLLTGGEPTLRKDFTDILISASKDGRIRTAGIFSNGLRKEPILHAIECAMEESSIRINLQTSIDGLVKFHDHNRRVPGALQKAFDAIQSVNNLKSKYGNRIGRVVATTAISRTNLNDLEEIINLALGTGASLAFAFVRGSKDGVFNLSDSSLLSEFEPEEKKADGSDKFRKDDFLTVEDMDHALDVLERKLWCRFPDTLVYAYNRITLRAIRNTLAEKRSQLTQECRMGYDDLVILPNGDVARCEMLAANASLANYQWELPALLQGPEWQQNLQSTSGCWCTHDCGLGVSIMKEPTLIKKLVRNRENDLTRAPQSAVS